MEVNPILIKNLSEITSVKPTDRFIVFRKNNKNEYESFDVDFKTLDAMIVKRDVLPEILDKLKSIIDKYNNLISVLKQKFILKSDAKKIFASKDDSNNAQLNLLSKDKFIKDADNSLAMNSLISYIKSGIINDALYMKYKIMTTKNKGKPYYVGSNKAIRLHVIKKKKEG